MFEAYKVATTLSVTNKVSSVLAVIASDFAKTDKSAGKLIVTLRGLNAAQLGLAGAMVGASGLFGIHLLKKAYEASKEYEKVFAQFKAFNLGDIVNEDADKFARGTNVFGVSSTKLMGTLRDLETVFGKGEDNYRKAKMLAPLIAQVEYANKAVGGDKAAAFDDAQRMSMAKVIERRGGFESTDAMKGNVDYMQRVMAGSGFLVLPRQYQNLMQTGGIAALKMADSAFYYENEPLIQEMGGSRVGTGLMTAYNRMVLGSGAGGPGGKAYLELLDKLGLVDDSKIEHNKLTGKITKVQAGYLKGTQSYINDPYQWVEGTLVPALQKAGYNEDQIETAISQVMGRTGGALFGLNHIQTIKGKIGKNIAMDMGAMNSDQLIAMAAQTPQGAQDAFAEAQKRFGTAIGGAPTIIATKALLGLTTAINLLSDSLAAHPYAAMALGGIATALSLTATLGGGLMIAGAALKLIGPALTAITGVPLAAAATGLSVFAGALSGLVALVVALDHSSEIGKYISGTWADKYNPFNAAERGGEAIGGWLKGGKSGGNRSWAPSSSNHGNVIINNYIDPERNTQSVVNRMTGKMSGPATSGSGFDARQSFTQPGFSGGW